MINYVELAQKIATKLNTLPKIHGIISESSLSEFDHAHPYMSVNLNIYYAQKGLPSIENRRTILETFGIEVSNETQNRTYGHKDEIPFELYCIDHSSLQDFVRNLETCDWNSYEKNVETFYNIQHGNILVNNHNWLQEIEDTLKAPPEMMWINLKSYAVSRMTLDLALLEDALTHHDRVLTIQAQGRFLESLLHVLFLTNKQFSPPLRLRQLELERLQLLPFDFASRFDDLLDLHVDSTHRLQTALQLATELTLL